MEQQSITWPLLNKILFRFFFAFVLLIICSFSFPHTYIPDVGKFGTSFFELMAKWTAKNILHLKHSYTSRIISDSTGMYINFLNIFAISLIICGIWTLADRKRKNYQLLCYTFFVFVRYYLAMQLLMYGFSKIFKWQFYLPEPNTLFTTLGNTSKDLLYWSTMGASRSYTMFTGIIEVLAGVLLLFKRTKLLGAVIAAAAMINIVMINFSFDISVKLYSCFLLLLCCIIIAPYSKKLFYFFVLDKKFEGEERKDVHYPRKKNSIYIISKTLVIVFLFADALAVYFKTKNFNDDFAVRPLLHGAYEVKAFIKGNDTLPPLLSDTLRWKRMFIHRREYLIAQFMNDEMKDYKLEYDTGHRHLVLNGYDSSQIILGYALPNDTTLILNGSMQNDSVKIFFKKINLHSLPLLKNQFNWTIDQ